MRPSGLLLVSGVQLAAFLAPLFLARTGEVGGEIAGLLSITGWFVVGMPLSYAVADRLRRRRALRIASEPTRHSSVSVRRLFVSSS